MYALRTQSSESAARVTTLEKEVIAIQHDRDVVVAAIQHDRDEVVAAIKHDRDEVVAALKNVTLERDRALAALNDVDTPTGLANLLHLSPNSKEAVSKATKRGVLRTDTSASPGERRNQFMESVAAAYTPIIEKVVSTPTFQGVSRPKRVLEQVVHRISTKRKGAAIIHGRRRVRKLILNAAKLPKKKPNAEPECKIGVHTDKFLSEMGTSWRQARRNNDRDGAARILQISLKAIPKGTGRVSDWLGPKFFDEVKPITTGCRVRILRESDHSKFRNVYKNSCLGGCHLATLPPCHPATLPPCHLATLPPCHLATLSPCHSATLPSLYS